MKQNANNALMVLSVLAALIAGYDSLSGSSVLTLAGTQWMLIAIILALYGIYAKIKMN
jgi:hypothetical protein